MADHRPSERLIDTLRMMRRTIGPTKHEPIPDIADTCRCRPREHRTPMGAKNLHHRRVELLSVVSRDVVASLRRALLGETRSVSANRSFTDARP